MSITDELRDWFKDRLFMGNGYAELTAIADRIDAEHEAKVSYWQGASYKDGYDEGFASADDWLADHEDAMAEHGWVKLPVDADGVLIRVGDVLDGYGKTIEVVELRIGRSGWVIVSGEGNAYADTFAFSHHHAPTVEDVLREFAQRWDDPTHYAKGELVEQYAAKLRLAGDAE